MQQIYRRTPTPKWNFNKVALQLHWIHISACIPSPVNLLHIFRTSLENISLEGDKASHSFWKTDQPASYQCSFYFTTLQFSVAIAVKYWKTQEQMGALARNWFNMWPFISTKISKQMRTLAGNRLRDRLPI